MSVSVWTFSIQRIDSVPTKFSIFYNHTALIDIKFLELESSLYYKKFKQN